MSFFVYLLSSILGTKLIKLTLKRFQIRRDGLAKWADPSVEPVKSHHT